MRKWYAYPTSYYTDEGAKKTIGNLNGCCGVGEMRGFISDKDAIHDHRYPAIDEFDRGPYTDIFVCTYTKQQQEDGLEDALNDAHTLLYQTDFIINRGPQATEDGRIRGVRTAIYKWGKQTGKEQ